ncbi:hypothetical protein PPYR_14173 [Photinus pyralis]|uniref:L-lactate dehydrogenase n=3 Tax=Photinus pyralis TaxID=7054 RepID=A0A5N4A4E6_PHOPY|nr:L-lactate dehydrogenase B chain-like [Photinus pyralis]KAB0792214.1 hypothetical protein PPYR_14173 [Photinus pyralis]
MLWCSIIRRQFCRPQLQIRHSSCSGAESITKKSIIQSYSKESVCPENKISIIGFGAVGQALCATLLLKNVTTHIAITDPNLDDRLLHDYQFGSVFFKNAVIEGSRDYAVICQSRICVIAAGVRPRKGVTRIDIASDNVKLLRSIIPNVVRHSPNSIILIISNPVDVLTWATAQLTGLPKHQVIGSGCNLDSARLRYLMSEIYGVACSSCQGWILGEHGNSSAPMYSTWTVGGAYVSDLNTSMGSANDVDNWQGIYERMREGGATVNSFKGYTNWAVALSATDIINTIIHDTRKVHAVTVCANGYYGLKTDVYLSLPSVLCKNGILDIVQMDVPQSEWEKLNASAEYLYSIQKKISL